MALPITACGLRLDDEAVRIAVALRLGSELGSSHSCRCGSSVDARGTHGLVCKRAPSRVLRHHALNECVSRAFSAAGIPVKKEPSGLAHKDGKRPWRLHAHSLARRLTAGLGCHSLHHTVADSYLTAASHTAEQAADRKYQKYAELSAAYEFQPMAVETHGPLSASTVSFLLDLGRKISERTGEPLEVQFLFQRISILV